MHLNTPRTLIRDFCLEDADGLQEILGDAETMKYCEPAYTPDQTSAFLTTFCIGQHGAVAVVHRESGKLIGYILFHDFGDGVYETGWIFNRSYWGQGYAYEACRAVIDCAFSTLHAHKLFAETIDAEKSVGLMRKLGMQPEGVQRRQVRDVEGNWRDVYLYGLLETDRNF